MTPAKRKRPTKKPTAKKTPARKTPAKKTPAKKTPAKKRERPHATGADQVLACIDGSRHALQAGLRPLRELVLGAADLTEHIKWNAPSFCHRGEDRVTFNLHAADRIRLVFHRGAQRSVTGERRLIEDPTGLLEWAASDRALLTFRSVEEIRERAAALQDLVARWVVAAAN